MPPLSAKAWEKRHSRKRGNGTVLRRNPGRGDGSTWKSRGYICAAAVEDCSIDGVHDTEEYDASEAFLPVSFSRTVSLFDGVQLLPSKRQRKAKSRLGDFEILGSNPKVIPIDNDCSDTGEDEWEKVDVSDISGGRRITYSQVLQS